MRRALLAVASALVLAPPAGGATVHVGTTGTVDYAAAPGEVNVLQASASGTTVTLADDGATIASGLGCSSVSAHRATCGTASFPALTAELGDGDDRATVSGLLSAVIDGGAGADVLSGGDARDVLEGGAGSDDLRGGAADDSLFGDGPGLAGGGGADRLTGGPGADVLDCGEGDDADVDGEAADSVTYCERAESTASPPPPPTTTTPPATTPPPTPTASEPLAQAAQASADPMSPGVIVALQQVPAQAAGSKTTLPVALTLKAPVAIRRTSLRRAGLRITLACSTPCRATLRLARGMRTLGRRTVTAGPIAKAVRLRARTTAGASTLRVTAPGVTSRTKRLRVSAG
ncbi:MAG: hypothetical protein ABI950_13015 [Solirubrobacteraceae bacterium]